MAKILAVGIATLDIINTVERYPLLDGETRALSQHKTRGGNATNTLAVLSQLGHQCYWAGVLIDETDTQLIRKDLALYNIDISGCQKAANGKMPTSYITLDQQTGSRTIVHFRDCPEYGFASFKALDLAAYDWIHFEGRNITETRLMLQYLKKTSSFYSLFTRNRKTTLGYCEFVSSNYCSSFLSRLRAKKRKKRSY